MSDGSPYRYIGLFYGDTNIANGSEKKNISTNVTVTTHIPKVRMIISVRLEASLLSYSRYLSERADGSRRGYVLSDQNDLLSITDASIYTEDCYRIVFPDKYIEFGDPTPRDYLAALIDARQNDPVKYNDLAKLAARTTYTFYLDKDYLSPYFSANLSVTKEIRDIASISFFANNFFNNSGQVYSSKTKTYTSVGKYIPQFYYGLSLRLKF